MNTELPLSEAAAARFIAEFVEVVTSSAYRYNVNRSVLESKALQSVRLVLAVRQPCGPGLSLQEMTAICEVDAMRLGGIRL